MGALACSAAKGYRTLTQSVPVAGALLGGAVPEIGSYLLERLYCDKDPFTEPFKPGICPIPYSFVVTYRITGDPNTSRNGTFTASGTAWGPIGAARISRTTTGDVPASDRASVFLPNYGPVNMDRGSLISSQVAGPVALAPIAQITILNVTSAPLDASNDGRCPDNKEIIPYRPEDFTGPVKIPYTPPSGVSVTLPFVAVIGLMYVDADFNLNMPVTFKLEPGAIDLDFNFEFKGTLNLTTGDTTIDWTGGEEPNTPPPALPPASRPPILSPDKPPAPPKPPSVPDAEPDTVEAEQGRVLIGVIVTSVYSTSDSNITRIFQRDNPSVYVPYLGLVSFAVRTADGSVGWTNDIPVKNLRAFIPAPTVSGVIAVRGTARLPVTWELTPVYEQQLVLAGGG